ncbi:hydrogen peroxide-inducible genes activator [Lacibacter sp.]|uniref:hydrogen peroxide-inducible genes activator n=1 Tax=Lacibacter sp. TaxID=1915409 RepID=UPI002B4B6FD4|nr:LysR substrate-binding domain-containing protein [Lacibacter sp.]HLP39354.1 LysR substrate-binding domain-containing protein [Lacibacter sp.]
MTLTQLEYIVALDTHRHFVLASEKCFVTQPTLSMQIQKLEEELGVKIFDRTKQPVIPTEIGASIIAQARVVLRDAGLIRQLISEQKDSMSGEIRIGIIPTIAPYLLPPLFKNIREKYPQVNLVVREIITEEIVQELKNNRLDCGIVVTPLKDSSIKEDVLFYEELFVYVSKNNALYDKKYVLPNEIDPNQLWLLEEGHCFRSQILNLCELQKFSAINFRYETGNIETLKRMVDKSDGITILPELAVMEFTKPQMKFVKQLKEPRPAREVSLVIHRDHLKTKLIQTLKEEILAIVPKPMQKLNRKKVVDISY